MRKILLALPALVLLGAAAGCTDDDDMDPGDDGGDGGGDGGPPFTSGVSTLAGSGEAGDIDGSRGQARFSNPVNVALGPDGRVYVADFDNGRIRVVDAETGATSTLISRQGFSRPFAIAFAADGTMYVSTDRNPQGVHGPMAGTIWRVDIAAKTATPVSADMGRPRGMVALPDGTLAVSDYMHHVIQILDPRTGALTLLAGAWDAKGLVDGIGGAARFSTPYDMVYVNGGLVVADYDNHQLRRVELDGRVSVFAGAGVAGYADGALATARFNRPQGLAVAANGDIYVTDLGNHRVRRLRAGNVETVAGNGSAGFLDDDNPLASQFYGLEGIDVRPDGTKAFIADGNRGDDSAHHRVRRLEKL